MKHCFLESIAPYSAILLYVVCQTPLLVFGRLSITIHDLMA